MRKLMQAAPTALPIPAPSAAPPAPAPSPLPTIARLHTEATLTGMLALKFYDVWEDFSPSRSCSRTTRRPVGDGQTNTCSDIVNALEALPNTVVEHDVHCQERNVGVGYGGQCGVTYSLTYTGTRGT